MSVWTNRACKLRLCCTACPSFLPRYGASYIFVETLGGWRYMYGLALVPAALLGAGMAFLPESPRWLQLSGAGPAAVVDALRRTKGGAASESAVQAELAEIEAAMALSPKAASTGTFGEARAPGLQALSVHSWEPGGSAADVKERLCPLF